MQNFSKDVKMILTEIENLLINKNKKYGNSALQPKRIFSSSGPLDQLLNRIDDKLSRIAGLGDQIDTPPYTDTVNDLIGYLVILQIARNQITNKNIEKA